jgi:HSP90 family molecular chaperone
LRDEKLVHQSVPHEMRGAVQALAATLNHAIELLAKDIYSNDARFLSELLQNAE